MLRLPTIESFNRYALPEVPRLDLYHRQNKSLLGLESEKGWVMGIDPKHFGP